ncbi:M55 family metallopeptidase [Alkaliphilus pronyensis]|uniref:M55 family metallopeptidase n=1 Tax=Alkaliphilus pronyensis TaxID=1482732 RepID=A0A6I0F136_9FIRM|nr:M55 family metallopeptidase [Alkaliphilus pronyensis]KAB3534484.1 M55 family metallopeptidase [Alkaliphilus pronyensis]
MKFYISADIEGVSGVVNKTHGSPSGHDYSRARKLMTEEVNAAIKALQNNGATKIVVNDSHGPMTNILLEDLNSAAELITGTPKRLGMMEGIDETFDAVLFIGYHSRMNTAGVLSHSYHGGVVNSIRINGREAGEFLLNSLVAGSYKVPVIMASGDNILSEEVKDINSDIETAVVKISRGRFAAQSLNPVIAHKKIQDSVNTALKAIKSIKPIIINGSIELEITLVNSGMAEIASIIPGVTLSSPSTITYRAKNIIEAYQVLRCTTLIANNTLL